MRIDVELRATLDPFLERHAKRIVDAKVEFIPVVWLREVDFTVASFLVLLVHDRSNKQVVADHILVVKDPVILKRYISLTSAGYAACV